ncbi:MAG: alanine--tRNA ligase [Candidatus Paceibacterota bacterium]|jgi:alanyl-tRNA synthetase
MTVNEVRRRYLEFFAKRGHTIIPSAPIVPENDPTTLFTSSGMQPLVPYLLGQPHSAGKRLANSQTCFRAQDIEEVGDNRHTTFFEMLGNWSLGDYFKQEQLPWLYEFLTTELELPKDRLWVTCFAGDEVFNLPRDTESAEIWKKLGVPEDHIHFYDAKKNWWSRSGTPDKMPAGELGGPDSEIFFDFGTPHDPAFGETCHPNCDCGRFMEIGNSVFMEYVKNGSGSFDKLPQQNVDFGGGLERLTAATRDNSDVFLIDTFDAARAVLEKHSGMQYRDIVSPVSDTGLTMSKLRAFRIILDHVRAASVMFDAGLHPTNTEQGYVLRRLIRRAIREMDRLSIKEAILGEIAGGHEDEFRAEEMQFRKTLSHGLRELEKMGSNVDAFMLFTTYGFPIELTEEIARERGITIDIDVVRAKMAEHQALSRSGAAQKFTGGLADASEATTKLHTAHHLLLNALQRVLGSEVHQRGSNITGERLRIDFSYGQKMVPEQIAEVEKIVNEQIEQALPVEHLTLPKEEAEKLGAEHEFGAKYPDMVSVYRIGSSLEFCGGPHVHNTAELGHFKIMKEEASSAGVRRIKAVLE